MKKQISNYGTIGFCLLWIFLIILDYWYYHPNLYLSIFFFQYSAMAGVLTFVGVLAGLFLMKFNKFSRFLCNGIGALLLFLIISGIIIVMHFNLLGTNLELQTSEVLLYLGKVLFILACTYFVFGACYVLGAAIIDNLFSIKLRKLESILIKIGTGITFLSIVLFILGAFDLLMQPILWGILLAIIAVFWRKTLSFLKVTLIQTPTSIGQLNWIGFLSIYCILIFISLIYLQNIRPAPFGFDALALYMNIPKLIWEQGGLVEGFTPYYWSLFVTLGYILVDQIELVFSLSVAGGVLTAFAIYALARRWLSNNYSLVTVIAFYSLPMVNWQSYKDVKTDLGLLFILMVIILILVNYVEQLYAKTTDVFLKKQEFQFVLLLGLLSGFAMGIKLTSLILIFSIVAIFFYFKVGVIGLITSSLFTFLVILVGGLDVASGLRPYHFGTDWLRWVVLGVSVIGFGFLAFKYKRKMVNLVMICALFASSTGLTYLPWPIKHYKESGVLNFETIIKGKGQNPPPPSI